MSGRSVTLFNTSRIALHRFFGGKAGLVIFLMTLIAYGYFFHRYRFWNVNSRLALTYAIVDHGTFQIDPYVNHPYTVTKDRAWYQGHYYSDKIIGLSLLGVPVYWCMKHIFAFAGRDPKPDFSRYGVTVAIVSFSAALLMVVLLRFLVLLGQTQANACLVVLFFAFGTMLFPFACLFYPYLPSLLFLISAFYLVVRWRDQGLLAERPVWLPGSLIGLALLCEYTLAVPAALIAFYFLVSLRRTPSRIFHFCLSATVPLGVFAVYNFICFGNPFSLPYTHLENPEFRDGMSQGLMGIRHFQWYVLCLVTIHPYRGIFFYSPFLLLGFIGLFRGLRSNVIQHRWLAGMVWVVVCYYLYLNASYYMWWGGGTLLARHLIPMLPFLALAFAWLPDRLRSLLLLLGFVSIALTFPQSVVEPHFEPFESSSDLYRPWQTVVRTGHGFVPPFLRHAWPAFVRGQVSINPFNLHTKITSGKLWTLLPLLLIELGLLIWLRRVILKEGQWAASKR